MEKENLQSLSSLFLILLMFGFSISAFAQEVRSIDGIGNNVQHPEWGAVGTNQLQIVTNGYADGISLPAGTDRPNPRLISNEVFDQAGLLPDAMGLSDYAWVWGQFIDHNITLVVDHPTEAMGILVPSGDAYFDPAGTGIMVIGMNRSAYDPNSGTDPSNPRAYPNGITSFIDASGVYGSDENRAAWLRTFDGGKLKMSGGNLLPYNTYSGGFGSPVDPNAPGMAMPFPQVEKWFVAGDVRANENPLLTSIHTLFAREHNRLCDELAVEHPSWTDEQLYQHARRIVGGLIQAVVYEEWLPTMEVNIGPYSGYDAEIDPGILNVFSAAAYRYGHTVINSTIIRMDNAGNIIPAGNLLLKDAFFNPGVVLSSGGIESLLKGMATQIEQEFDCKMINDLRNFLFGPPGAGGLDLAALNINRGRERGLPDYNTIRADFGLSPVADFSTLTANPWLNQVLEGVYGNINDLDPWVGMLAEDHMANTLFGETVMTIMERQFQDLRDGDRFYYENDAGLSAEEIAEIKNTRLVDIIMRNSDVAFMQDNVFVAQGHTVVAVSEAVADPFNMAVSPNPVSSDFQVRLFAEESGNGTIRIADLLGRLVEESKVQVSKGNNTLELSLANGLPAGMYNLSLHLNGKAGNKRILKTN